MCSRMANGDASQWQQVTAWVRTKMGTYWWNIMYITQIDIYTLIFFFFFIYAYEWLRVFMKFGNLCAVYGLALPFLLLLAFWLSVYISFSLKWKFFFSSTSSFQLVLFVCSLLQRSHTTNVLAIIYQMWN